MDHRDDLFREIPFYMTYPMQNLYLTEMEYEKDMERMKALYPRQVQSLQKMVEDRCNQMEYEGSRMYDENPDRRMLEEEVERIAERYLYENQPSAMPMDMGMGDMNTKIYAQNRQDDGWLRSLISILFHDEIYRRRCRHRRCRRWW